MISYLCMPGKFVCILQRKNIPSSIVMSSNLPETFLYADLVQGQFKSVLMARFLYPPYPIDGVKFKPIKLDIHQRVIKINDDEIFYDFQLNTTESV
jgi:hypothetical protein